MARASNRIRLGLLGAASALFAAAVLIQGGGAPPADASVPSAESELPTMRRLTESQYRATIADIFGPGIKLNGRPEPDLRVDGLYAAGTGTVSVTPGGAQQYAIIARGVADQVVAPENRERFVGCTPGADDPDGRACASRFFRDVGKRLFRRPLTEAELQLAVSGSLAAGDRLGDFHRGLATGLAGMMVDLPFLFQIDSFTTDPSGAQILDGWSRATKLSYFLWNSTPDEELLRAAESGELMRAEGFSRQVDRLLGSPRFEEGARAFFDDFFRLDAATRLVKDPIIYPAFRASVGAAAREQTLRTTIQLLVREKGDYRDLFTTRRVAMNRTLSPLYRIAYAPTDWSIIEMPEGDPRTGLLSQISFLAMHSHEGRSSPTLRGLAVREILMCEHVPPPPANVNFIIVQDTGNPEFRTARERLAAHLEDEDCASCHKKTDHIGLAFEKFDGAGQFRATETGAPIDTSGQLDAEAFADPSGLGKALRANRQTTECVAQAAFKSAAGRPLVAGDAGPLAALYRSFEANGFRIDGLFRNIAESSAFVAGPRGDPRKLALAPTIQRSGDYRK